MLGVGEWQGSGGVEVIREGLLGLFDGLGLVLGRDFVEVWELCGGGEVVGEDGEEGFGDWHARWFQAESVCGIW